MFLHMQPGPCSHQPSADSAQPLFPAILWHGFTPIRNSGVCLSEAGARSAIYPYFSLRRLEVTEEKDSPLSGALSFEMSLGLCLPPYTASQRLPTLTQPRNHVLKPGHLSHLLPGSGALQGHCLMVLAEGTQCQWTTRQRTSRKAAKRSSQAAVWRIHLGTTGIAA